MSGRSFIDAFSTEPDRPSKRQPLASAKARFALFGALAGAMALLAMPRQLEEAALVHVGERLCEHSVNGAPIDADMHWRGAWYRPRLVQGQFKNLSDHLGHLRPFLTERCRVMFWRGDIDLGGGADYVLYVGDGSDLAFVLMSVEAGKFFSGTSFDILGMGAGWPIAEPEARHGTEP